MSNLFEALTALSPISFSDIPTTESELAAYLRSVFSASRLLIDSVPHDPPVSSDSARSTSGIATSSAIPPSPLPQHAQFQKDWGKPLKLSAKDNPRNVGVYKLAGRDGKGAWFARRSVHEGMSFERWKRALQAEFPESLKVQGGPGEGNVRGIGAERRIERNFVNAVGCVEVFHLSAQFPGPTTPRDFVTLFLSSDTALDPNPEEDEHEASGNLENEPKEEGRYFLVVSKPCLHDDCPPRNGYIRGYYESLEFIREVPRRIRASVSDNNLPLKSGESKPVPLTRAATTRHAAENDADAPPTLRRAETHYPGIDRSVSGRLRSHTVSETSYHRREDVYEDDESDSNLVEWIMITRSDPGGSVPRFMVERGTPAGIAGDASKFLDWAAKIHHTSNEAKDELGGDLKGTTSHASTATNGTSSVSVSTGSASVESPALTAPTSAPRHANDNASLEGIRPTSTSALSSIANTAQAAIESYAPKSVLSRLPAFDGVISATSNQPRSRSSYEKLPKVRSLSRSASRASSSSSSVSFASAEDFQDSHSRSHQSAEPPSLGLSSRSPSQTFHPSKDINTPYERVLQQHGQRKARLEAKYRKEREKYLPVSSKEKSKSKQANTSKDGKSTPNSLTSDLRDNADVAVAARLAELPDKEKQALHRLDEKYKREFAKLDERHSKEVQQIDQKRERDSKRGEEKQRKEREKDEREKLRRERDETREKLKAAESRIKELEVQVERMARGFEGIRDVFEGKKS